MKVLLIDDTRDETSPNIQMKIDLIARTYEAAIDALMVMGPWDLVLLDHDLNSYNKDGKEKTGYDIVCFLERTPSCLPIDIKLVSSNPPGRARMAQVLSKLYNKEIK